MAAVFARCAGCCCPGRGPHPPPSGDGDDSAPRPDRHLRPHPRPRPEGAGASSPPGDPHAAPCAHEPCAAQAAVLGRCLPRPERCDASFSSLPPPRRQPQAWGGKPPKPAAHASASCLPSPPSRPGSASHPRGQDEAASHPVGVRGSHWAKALEQYRACVESAPGVCRAVLDRLRPGDRCASQAERTSTALEAGRHAHPPPHDPRRPIMCRSGQAPPPHACGDDHGRDRLTAPPLVRHGAGDLEKGRRLRPVAVSVDGMTCSGCGNKMQRALAAIPAVSSIQVNFVMGAVHFSLDTSLASPDDVIGALHRATAFRYTQLLDHHQSLDVLSTGRPARSLIDADVPGFVQATIVDKHVVRLTYDPTAVGARALMRQVGSRATGLAPPRDDAGLSSGRKSLRTGLIKTAIVACLTLPVLVLAWSDTGLKARVQGCISLPLATAVQLFAVPDFYLPALSALVHHGSVEMDMLVVISITAAYLYSVVIFALTLVGTPLDAKPFFETSTLLITLVLLGRLVAAFARIRAVAAVSFRSLQATRAVIIEHGRQRDIDARLLQYGDLLIIHPHAVVPTDATVLGGSSDVDESMMTGESMPVLKHEGHDIVAGTLNGSGTLTARLSRLPGKNTVTDIARLVEEATNSKPRLQDLADRVASYFVPAVGCISLVVLVVWIAIGFKVRHLGAQKALPEAMTYAIATLAVSCPCALGLAVPIVLVVAGGIAARNGVVVKSARCTERARKVTDVVFDKTGTLTEAHLDVVAGHYFVQDQQGAVAITKALVAGNRHPVSLAVARHLEQRPVPAAALTHVRVVPGAGVAASLGDSPVQAGNPRWTESSAHPTVAQLQERGMTLLVVKRGGKPIAAFAMRTRLRVEASRVIAGLRRQNLIVHLVSGDQASAVEAVAAQLAISRLSSQCTPVEKRDYVAALMARGRNVMFVGDGVNDAVAVTQADVGVQLASVQSASDVTRSAADVVLLNGLEGVLLLLRISAVSFRRIAFNFVWSGLYNCIAILAAAGVLVRVRMPPAYAGLGEMVSVLPVILAALTMLLCDIKTRDGDESPLDQPTSGRGPGEGGKRPEESSL